MALKPFRLTWRKLIVLLVVVLVFLQLIHISLLNKLEAKYDKIMTVKLKETLQKVKEKSIKMRLRMQHALDTSHILDSSGEYSIVNNFVNFDSLQMNGVFSVMPDRPGVTIVTQCSVNNLYNLVQLNSQWEGKISVTIFAPGNHLIIASEILLKIYQCHPNMKTKLSIHLAFPISRIHPQIQRDNSALEEVDCHNLQDFIHTSFKNSLQNYASVGVKYPNNLLRNIALHNVRTEYVFVIDIDMLPNSGLHKQFMNLSRSRGLKSLKTTVYVVPAFEIRVGKPFPRVKSELLDMWNKNNIRPFYFEMCWKCQNVTGYERWKRLNYSEDLEIAYELEWRDPWEPFFIAHKDVALYDERFKQYGFNRISQVCELHIAGYNFAVLNNAFVVHEGFKTATNFHSSKTEELNQNRLLFRKFKEELKTKYPHSSRRCY